MDENLQLALSEEKELVFDEFNSRIAYEIGKKISEYSFKNNPEVCVDIFAYNKTLYHFTGDNSSCENDNWLRRKRNTVLHFQHSSKYVYYRIKGDQNLLAQRWGLDLKDYVGIMGGVPIFVKNNGFVGAICVSGLSMEQDHQLAVDTIKEFLCNR
ncbi:MAG: heme-binding protein [Erysipelotrichaceae bacterium]